MSYVALITALGVLGAVPSLAEVGVTDVCQEEADSLLEHINDNNDDYTAESCSKAKNHLLATRTNRLNPAKCRSTILDARETKISMSKNCAG